MIKQKRPARKLAGRFFVVRSPSLREGARSQALARKRTASAAPSRIWHVTNLEQLLCLLAEAALQRVPINPAQSNTVDREGTRSRLASSHPNRHPIEMRCWNYSAMCFQSEMTRYVDG